MHQLPRLFRAYRYKRSPVLVCALCGDRQASRDEALERVQSILSELLGLLAAAGAGQRQAKRSK